MTPASRRADLFSSRIRAALARFVVVAALGSGLLFTIAASSYPGGSHFDHHALGHDFWRNSLCDVARSTAVGGAPNVVGAFFARVAMALMAFGVGAMLWLVPAHFPSSPRLGRAVRALTLFTVPALLVVVALPTDRFGDWHGIVITMAGLPGLTAGWLATAGLVRERSGLRLVTLLSVATLVVAAADFAIYVDEVIRGGPPRLAVPVLERIAGLLLVAWMIAIARCRPANRASTVEQRTR